jgi:SAM-dependent methyltransferase
LINEWQISPFEVDYIDRQQGKICTSCGSNLRSIALANALRAYFKTEMLLCEWVSSPAAKNVVMLEINQAGTLTPYLKQVGGYVFGAYPDLDMHAIPHGAGAFDVIVHSDTLEHIENPIHALTECRRALKLGGALCFTIPLIVGRLTRSRAGLPKSFHGNAETASDDLIVRTEFGSDAWTNIIEAGFSELSIHAVEYPAATAFMARKG